MTLVEVLVVLMLMVPVMGAILSMLTQAERSHAVNSKQNDSQEEARRAVDSVTRELRNLASPTNELPQAVARAGDSDLVFQSVATAGTRRVRYCLNTTTKRLWRQTQPLGSPPAALPTNTSCPAPSSSGWTTQRVVAEHVENGSGRPVFTYNSTTLTAITEIRANLYIDVNPGQSPDESLLQSSVFLRNQNRAPTASFTADPSSVTPPTLLLNGTGSEDPEEKALDYYWYDAGKTGNDAGCGTLPSEVPQNGCIGTGIVFYYQPSAAGNKTVYLVVRDPAGLTNQAASLTRCVGVCP
jgi:type II secretory pathway pseudopilin PulG